MKRTFVGGCTGYVSPTTRLSRPVGGCAKWVETWIHSQKRPG